MIAAFSVMMFRAGGYRAEGAFFNGLNGDGRQQSETGKMPPADTGEQSPDIWDEMSRKEKNS